MSERIRGNWRDIYLCQADIYDKFSRAEDYNNLIIKHIEKYRPLNGLNIIDLGAGTGRFSVQFAEKGANVVAVEPCSPMLDILKKRIRSMCYGLTGSISYLNAYAETLSLPPNSFDIAFSSWVLSELRILNQKIGDNTQNGDKRVEQAINNVRNSLRSNGMIFVVETSPGCYFGELQKELKGTSEDISDGFTDYLISKYNFKYDEFPIMIKFESKIEARTVCNNIFGQKAGDIIIRNNNQFSMNIRLLHWAK